jgi:hypothetical protein
VGDVKLFLAAYGVEIETSEAKQIAKRIGSYGDIDTLARAMRVIAGNVEGGELTWRKVGAGQIISAIDRIKTVIEGKDEEKE